MAEECAKEIPLSEIRHLRNELRIKLRDRIASRDPLESSTIIFTVASLLETHFDPTSIATLVGTSRTSIARWADGQNVPRSPGYRKWVVDTLLGHLTDAIEAEKAAEAA